jgi:hypothetical protein
MNQRVEEFLAARVAEYDVVAHPEAFTAQEQAAAAHVSGWSWAKVVVAPDERHVLDRVAAAFRTGAKIP